MRAYGTPVLLSTISTTIVVVPLLPPSSYILHSFSKIVIATVSLGAVHGLLVLPTLLAAFDDHLSVAGPAQASFSGMRGALMSIRRRIVQSADIMDSGALGVGTFRWHLLFVLGLEIQISLFQAHLIWSTVGEP